MMVACLIIHMEKIPQNNFQITINQLDVFHNICIKVNVFVKII